MILKHYLTVSLIIFLLSCSKDEKPKKPTLNQANKELIEKLSKRLVNSINSQDFSVINEFWSDDHFMVRVSTESKTQRSVLSHIFKTQIKQIIKTGNISIILDISSGNGKAYISKINHFDDYSEIMLLLTFDDRFNFFKYRVELEKGKPVISDFMTLTDNLWYSEKISLSLEINSKYNAYSEERRIANSGISSARYYQDVGDIEAALEALKSIPRTHYGGNAISIEKLILASEISPEVYEEVLKTEFKYNKSLYMKYLYHYYFDSIKLETVYQELEDEIGSPFVLDTLVESGRFWN